MDEVKRVLNEVFGLTKFRLNQELIISKILEHRDVFAIMPTGAGKSICFQIPALIFSGVTVVVSPLIALMKDQVNRLQSLNVKAIFLNRSLTTGQIRKLMNDTVKGLYKIIYVAPERLESEKFLDFIRKIDVSFVVVDEAHCVLHWGCGFRSSYLKIAKFFRCLEKRPVFAAFTATAKPQSVENICRILDLNNPFFVTSGFFRANLFFDVFNVEEKYKVKVLFKIFKIIKNEITIIYCQTRRVVDFLFNILKKKRFSVAKYHAGMSLEARRRNQTSFELGKVRILVATNAFGMGIDKRNVRNVVHFNMPKSLEDYYQQAGRAGRDGGFARCLVLYSENDVKVNKILIEKTKFHRNFTEQQINVFVDKQLQQLNEMIKYCKSKTCYSKQIVSYFGEKINLEFCHNCGNCARKFVDITEFVRTVAGCVDCLKNVDFKRLVRVLKGSFFSGSSLKNCIYFGKLKKMSVKNIKKYLTDTINQKIFFQNEKQQIKMTDEIKTLLLSKIDAKFYSDRNKNY